MAMAAAQALGERVEGRAAQPVRNRPGALVRALNYPDRRVQMAAAEALTRMPGSINHQAQARVVEILRRALSAESETIAPAKPRVLVGDFDQDRARDLGQVAQSAGFEPVFARTGQDVMRRLKEAGDIDFVLIAADIPYPPLPDLLASLRYDVHVGNLPVRVVYFPVDPVSFQSVQNEVRLKRPTPQTVSLRISEEQQAPESEARVRRWTEGLRQVAVLTAPVTPQALKQSFYIQTPVANGGPPLSPAERKRHAATAIELLRQMAVGTLPNYDVRPADQAIRQALRSEDLTKPAIEATGRLPGKEAQNDLAGVALDTKRPADVRALAADHLIRHIHRFGAVLTVQQAEAFQAQLPTAKDADLHSRLAAVVGTLTGDANTTGQRLKGYVPPKPAGKPAPAEKPVEKPEDKPAEKPEDKPAEKPPAG